MKNLTFETNKCIIRNLGTYKLLNMSAIIITHIGWDCGWDPDPGIDEGLT